jgi:hypothetical protein
LCCRVFARTGVCTRPNCTLLHKRTCKAWLGGKCPRGNKCELPHVRPEYTSEPKGGKPKGGDRQGSRSGSRSSGRSSSQKSDRSRSSPRGSRGSSP